MKSLLHTRSPAAIMNLEAGKPVSLLRPGGASHFFQSGNRPPPFSRKEDIPKTSIRSSWTNAPLSLPGGTFKSKNTRGSNMSKITHPTRPLADVNVLSRRDGSHEIVVCFLPDPDLLFGGEANSRA